jgi:hypothetical protein
MSDSQNYDKFHRPELFFAELLQKSASGKLQENGENVRFLYRATVLAVDVLGGKLENPTAVGSVSHSYNNKSVTFLSKIGPENPRNSIKARVLTDSLDGVTADEDLKIFWPLFPEHIMVPIKPGEHVYVIFEDTNFQHGLWLCKIPGHEGVNFVKGQSKFESDSSQSLSNKFSDSSGLAAQNETEKTDETEGGVESKSSKLGKLF